ncbi:hypothetical protein BDA96_01G004000 [Sorghum bicolor]|uniref:DUF3475 domain-containing protein n=1 Tax=Sorghum bicolor TaxID=4558 RepID=A0A921UVM7_SORBI|nr:hypothetical protein BDA96_01G004000 [Sorghum bicolor]
MAPLESWLTKVRSAMSSARSSSSGGSGAPPAGPRTKQTTVGILAFEVASLMSKLLHLWRAVGDAAVARLRHETIHLHGVRKVVSDDDEYLLGLACAELVDTLRAASDSVAALAARCADPSLRDFRDAFLELADSGRDRYRWAAPSWKEMNARASKMDKQVASTAALRRAMEELAEAEHGLRKLLVLQCNGNGNGNGGGHRRSLSASKISVAAEQQQLVFSKKQEVKHLKQTSLWGCTFDAAVASLARAVFTTLARIKAVFGAGQEQRHPPLYRSLTLSSAVHPSADARSESDTPPVSRESMSMEELLLFDLDQPSSFASKPKRQCGGFLEDSSAALTPPAGTLGAAALAPRYAGLVISIERMARSPRLVGPEERDELYGMLTASVRAQLRARLRGAVPAADPVLAGQWRAALAGILEWLAPMAHATVRWQAERSLEQRGPAVAARGGNGSVVLLQTLQFAERDRVDAAVVELLVGLNYVWRFEKEMSCRALFAVHHRQQAMMEGGGVEDTGNGTVGSAAACRWWW